MNQTTLKVCFEPPRDGFTARQGYEVLFIQDRRFLLIDDDAHLVWVEADETTPLRVMRAGELIFDLHTHRTRRRLEALAGKAVVMTTWENLGFPPDEETDEHMLVYRGIVDCYDGETLFLHRGDGDGERFGVLPGAIATIEEAG